MRHVDPARVKSRVAGRASANALLPAIVKEAKRHDAAGREAFWRVFANAAMDGASGPARAIKPARRLPTPETANASVADAERAVGELLDVIEDLPDKALDFGISVAEKARDILATVHRTGRVADAQSRALDAMDAGVRAWFHD